MEDFVTIEIAKSLKEKGVKLGTEHRYVEIIAGSEREEWDEESCNWVTYSSANIYPKPTIPQVLKWLREEKKIHICIDIYDDGWFFDIASFYKADTEVYEIDLPYKSSRVTPDYDSFEQAAIAGIEYVLNNLI